MCSWNFSKLFKEGSLVLRGKVCLWVMFLLLPRAIFRIIQIGENKTKKARLRLTSLFYFFFLIEHPLCHQELCHSLQWDPLLLPFIPSICLQHCKTTCSNFADLQMLFLGVCWTPTSSFAVVLPWELNRDFSVMSYELTLWSISEQGSALQSLPSVSPLLYSHCRDKMLLSKHKRFSAWM